MPIVTAGLKCAPETWPTAYAIVVTARPKAMATPRCPMPRLTGAGSESDLTTNFASKIAEPQPMKTSQKVPSASTARRELILGVYMGLLQQAGRGRATRESPGARQRSGPRWPHTVPAADLYADGTGSPRNSATREDQSPIGAMPACSRLWCDRTLHAGRGAGRGNASVVVGRT